LALLNGSAPIPFARRLARISHAHWEIVAVAKYEVAFFAAWVNFGSSSNELIAEKI
jgi:hypothetical protein